MPVIEISLAGDDGISVLNFKLDTQASNEVCAAVMDCIKNILPIALELLQTTKIKDSGASCYQVCSQMWKDVSDVADSAGANGDILKMLIELFMQLLPIILPYLTPKPAGKR